MSWLEGEGNRDHQLNRTKFHHALKATFEDWIADLRAGGDAALRGKMRDRMDQIIKITLRKVK
jgi:hypothetical protein